MDAQMFSSYNQQLFISIFNIINSYSNQKDTISKNINYLQYFYHLFPIHVEKFYFTFHSVINRHIDKINRFISVLSCCSANIPFYVSTLSRFSSTICSYGIPPDLQHFVRRHKGALDQVIDDIRERIYDGLKHIEDVLDNVTGNAYKDIPGVMKGICNDLLKENLSIGYISRWLSFLLQRILTLFVDGIHSKLSIDTGYYSKNLQWHYYLYEEKLSVVRKIVQEFRQPGERGKGIYIKHLTTFEKVQIKHFNEFHDALVKVNQGRRELGDHGIDQALKDSHALVTRVRRSLEAVISELNKDLRFKKEIYSDRILRNISTLEENVGLVERLKRNLYAIKPLGSVLSGVRALKTHYNRIQQFLLDDYRNLIQRLPVVVSPSIIEEQIIGLEKSLRHVIGKLQIAIGYQDDLRHLVAKIDQFPRVSDARSWTRCVQCLTQNIGRLECCFDEIKESIDHFICCIDRDFKVDGVQMKYIVKEPRNEICGIKKQLEAKTKAYIKKLKAVRNIEPDMKTIEQKKCLLSSARSDIVKIESVDDGIALLGKIHSTMKDFGFIATDITSLEKAYNFEPESLKDIEVSIGYLKGIITNTRKVISDVESYNQFLDGIERSSRKLENIKLELIGMSSVDNTRKRVMSYVSSLKDKLSSIDIDIGRLNQINCRAFDLKQVKQNTKEIRDVIVNLREKLVSVQRVSDSIHSQNAKISHQLKIINTLEQIGTDIESSSSTLSSLGISYSKPESVGLKNLVGCLFRAGRASEFIGSYTVKTIYGKIRSIEKEIEILEESIESLMKCFLKCSNKRITENAIESTKRLLTTGGQLYNNELTRTIPLTHNIPGIKNNENVWTLLSNMAVIESKFVLSKVYGCVKDSVEIIKNRNWLIHCPCMDYFKEIVENTMGPSDKMTSVSEFINNYKDAKYKKNIVVDNEGNHICLCMVIRHILYPNLVKCLGWLVDSDFDVLSTMSRQFDKYTGSFTYYAAKSKAIVSAIEVAIRLVLRMEEKYLEPGIKIEKFRVNWCFCANPNDPYYKYFISTLIYISSLVEYMFSHNETTGNSIQSLSALMSELEHVKCDKRDGGSSPCKVYSTSICVKVSNFQVNNTLFYKNDSCKIEFKQIKDPCLYAKICCCKNGVCEGQNYGTCQRTEGSYNWCCCNPNGTGDCINCSCNGSVKSTWKFIVDHGVSKVNSEYCLSKDIPNFWCLYKRILCILKDTAGPCGCDKIDCIKCIKGKASHYYRIVTRVNSKMIPYIFNTGILRLMSEMEINIKVFTKMGQIIKHEKLVKTTRNIRLYEKQDMASTKINSVNGGERNHYSYNDAYRINTSRAHGSLKYIIIKIVLILIIVVMTIFIRVKIETDDDYKMDNLLSDENGMCECSVENNENGRENGNKINMKYSGAKNNGTRKTSRTKGMKKKSLMIVMSMISGLYLNVVIRDLYVVLSLEYNVWSYFVSVVLCTYDKYCVYVLKVNLNNYDSSSVNVTKGS